jgi:hypothetical protein
MKRIPFARAVAAVLALVTIPSCTWVSNLISGNSGPADVDDLVEAVEKVNGELDSSKESMLAAVQKLQAVTAPDFKGDAVAAYKDLKKTIDSSDDQANDLRKCVEKMQAAAEPVFDQWTKDLEAYSNPEMRARSQQRLAAARERFDTVVAAVEPVLVEYETINQTLHDHALFLSHDMNPAAIATIQGDVRSVAKEASALDGSFNSAKAAARAYVDSAAQPKAVPAGETPEKAVPVKGQ